MEAREASRQPQYLRLKSAAYGEAQTVDWSAPGVGVWTLQPYLWAVGPFGEAMTVHVLPRRPRVRHGT